MKIICNHAKATTKKNNKNNHSYESKPEKTFDLIFYFNSKMAYIPCISQQYFTYWSASYSYF